MLKVSQLYARSFDLDHLDVFWEVENFSGNILQFDFYLYCSESSYGPWQKLAGPFQDQYYFRDTTAPQRHEFRTLYYLLKIVDKVTSEEAEFGPTSQSGEPDLIALEINRQEDVLFREFVGRRCWLFPVRTFGGYCVCYDRVAGKPTKSNCLNCYDTGFLGGYLSPIETFIQFDPSGGTSVATPNGERQPNNSSARLISFPQVKPKDILVEAENKRWKVESVSSTQRLRSVVHQELALSKVSKGDVAFKLPINVESLRALEISAERNFVLRQHTDGEPELEDILAAYGQQPRGTTR